MTISGCRLIQCFVPDYPNVRAQSFHLRGPGPAPSLQYRHILGRHRAGSDVFCDSCLSLMKSHRARPSTNPVRASRRCGIGQHCRGVGSSIGPPSIKQKGILQRSRPVESTSSLSLNMLEVTVLPHLPSQRDRKRFVGGRNDRMVSHNMVIMVCRSRFSSVIRPLRARKTRGRLQPVS